MSLHALVEKWRDLADDWLVAHEGPAAIARWTALKECSDDLYEALAGAGEAVAWMLRRKRDGAIRGCDRSAPTKFMLECAAIDGDEYVPLFTHHAGAVKVTDEAVRAALASYQLQFTKHDEDGPISLFDVLTPPGDVDIGRGKQELELLADHVASALNPGGSRE